MYTLFLILLIFCMLFSGHTMAEDQGEQQPSLILELPIVDYPFNWTDGYTAPSMQQSLHVTKNIYQYGH